MFSHALDYYGKKPNLHGIQVALGAIAMLKIRGKEYSVQLDYLKRFEVDVNPKSLGIDKETFVYCMQNASGMRNRYTFLEEVDLNTEKLERIYDELVEEL